MRPSYFVIVTGLSGAGKSQAIKCLEDAGFFCVDNLPTMLIPKFAEICAESRGGKLKRVALGIDIREGGFLNRLFDELKYLRKNQFSYEILFLEARTEVLIQRYSETRRTHPMGRKPLSASIKEERRKMAKLRQRADFIIDTSDINIHQLKERLMSTFSATDGRPLLVNVVSFGYRYGVPAEADMLFDVRFLPNPNYVPRLKASTGDQKKIRDYVLGSPLSKRFVEKLEDIMEFLLPQFEKEGKSYLTVAFGCTGGRHRSVVLANLFGKFVNDKGLEANVAHRDIGK